MQTNFVLILAAVAGTAFAAATGNMVRDVGSIESAAGCYWDGTAPICAGGCPEGYHEVDRNDHGNGATCWTGYKVYCCHD